MKICKYCSTRVDNNVNVCPGCKAEEFFYISDDAVASNEKQTSKTNNIIRFFKILIKAPRILKITLLVFVAIIALLSGIVAYLRAPKPVEEPVKSDTIELGFRNIGELATQAAYYTNVQVDSGYVHFFNTNVNVPLTKSKYIYSYDGIIKAGLDFSAITYEIDTEKKEITINLPEIKILSNEIDNNSFEIYDETKNIFNPLELKDLNEGQIAMKEKSQEKAIGNGLIESALSNAETLITGLCNGVYPDYSIIFKEGE